MYKIKRLKVKESALLQNCFDFTCNGTVYTMRKLYGMQVLLVRCGKYLYNVTDTPEIYFKASG